MQVFFKDVWFLRIQLREKLKAVLIKEDFLKNEKKIEQFYSGGIFLCLSKASGTPCGSHRQNLIFNENKRP